MTKKAKKSKKAARTAPAKLVALKKAPAGKKSAPDPAVAKDKPTPGEATPESVGPGTELVRISQLETERTNLMAQVAWARGVAQEQQKALEVERQRTEKLATDLETQRARVEQLKALSALDRLLGRHKRI